MESPGTDSLESWFVALWQSYIWTTDEKPKTLTIFIRRWRKGCSSALVPRPTDIVLRGQIRNLPKQWDLCLKAMGDFLTNFVSISHIKYFCFYLYICLISISTQIMKKTLNYFHLNTPDRITDILFRISKIPDFLFLMSHYNMKNFFNYSFKDHFTSYW